MTFGDDNLVLVDEGTLGGRRAEFGESVAGNSPVAGFRSSIPRHLIKWLVMTPELGEAYGKCLLFDYPYRNFHAEGYGKDYSILNLPGGAEDANSDMYLLGCLPDFLSAVPNLAGQGCAVVSIQRGQATLGVSWEDCEGIK